MELSLTCIEIAVILKLGFLILEKLLRVCMCCFDVFLNTVTRYKEWLERSKVADRMEEEEDGAIDENQVMRTKDGKRKKHSAKMEVYGSTRNKGGFFITAKVVFQQRTHSDKCDSNHYFEDNKLMEPDLGGGVVLPGVDNLQIS